MRIVIIGGGDLAQQVAYYIRTYDKKVEVIGFVDDFAEIGERRFGLSCLGHIDAVIELKIQGKFDAVLLAIGYTRLDIRQRLFDKFYGQVPFYTFIHPTAFIDSSATIGDGCCVGPQVIIEQGAIIEPNVFIYGGANVSHDSKIGSHSFLAPSVAIAGFVEIGQRCFIGLRAAIIERIRVADDVIIGAGAVVVSHLSEIGMYKGIPARKK